MAEVDNRRDYAAFLNSANYPLVKQTDMTAEERDAAVDICIAAVEKHSSDMEKCTQVGTQLDLQLVPTSIYIPEQVALRLTVCSQVIKDAMDKKFGPPWHIVAGKYFSYEVTYEVRLAFVQVSTKRRAVTS